MHFETSPVANFWFLYFANGKFNKQSKQSPRSFLFFVNFSIMKRICEYWFFVLWRWTFRFLFSNGSYICDFAMFLVCILLWVSLVNGLTPTISYARKLSFHDLSTKINWKTQFWKQRRPIRVQILDLCNKCCLVQGFSIFVYTIWLAQHRVVLMCHLLPDFFFSDTHRWVLCKICRTSQIFWHEIFKNQNVDKSLIKSSTRVLIAHTCANLDKEITQILSSRLFQSQH